MRYLKSMLILSTTTILLSACVTLSGNYQVKAYDSQGKPIETPVFYAEGSGIYPVIQGFCQAYPQSTVKVFNTDTGEELKSEEKHCR